MDMDQNIEIEYHQSPCVTHSKKWSQIGEWIFCEYLGEYVSSLLCRWEILQWYHMLIHQDPNVVNVYLYVIGPLSLHYINGNLDFTFIVTPNDSGWTECKSNFSKNTLQPHTLCSCVHWSSVLGLSWLNWYSVMFLNLK